MKSLMLGTVLVLTGCGLTSSHATHDAAPAGDGGSPSFGTVDRSTGSGTTFYVSLSGNDSNPGTSSAPFRHVSKGVAAATAGDTVVVANGTYDNEGQVSPSYVVTLQNSGTAQSPITITAQNRGEAILDSGNTSTGDDDTCNGAASYFNLYNSSFIVLQGFVMQNSCLEGIHSNDSAHDIVIRWNEIRYIANHLVSNQIGHDGIYLNDTESKFTFDGNSFHDIGRTSGQTLNHFDHGIYSAAADVTTVNNLFYNMNKGFSIQVAPYGTGATNWLIANNTFALNNLVTGEAGDIELWSTSADIVIENNIFYNPIISPLGSYQPSTSGSSFDYNLVYGTTNVGAPSGMTVGSHNVMGTSSAYNPGFVNLSAYDFLLGPGSGAAGIAANLWSTFEDDFDGGSRPATGAWDAGAYISGSSSPTPSPTPSPPLAPAMSLSPRALSFASQRVGTTSAVQYITVQNTGNATMTFASPAISGSGFAFAGLGTCASSLAVGQTCTYSVEFTPAAAGTPTGAVVINDNAPGAPHTVPLSGVAATANLVLNPGFENGLTSWSNWGNSSVVRSPVRSGSHALRVGTGTGGVVQNISGLAANGTYAFSAYAFMNNPSAQWASLQVAFQTASGSDISGYVYTAHITSTSYALYSMSVTAPSGFDHVQVRIWNNAGSSYVYVDDFNLH